MTRLALLSLGTAIGLAFSAGGASASPLQALSDFDQASGSAMVLADLDRLEDGGIFVRNWRMSRYDVVFKAESFHLDGQGQIRITNLSAERKGGGRITADRLDISSISGLWDLLSVTSLEAHLDEMSPDERFAFEAEWISHMEPDCGGLTESGKMSRRLSVQNLRLIGDPSAMPVKLPGQEEVRLDGFIWGTTFDRSGAECRDRVDMEFTGGRVIAHDGAMMTVASGRSVTTGRVNLDEPDTTSDERSDYVLEKLELLLSNGQPAGTVGTIRLGWGVNSTLWNLFCALTLKDMPEYDGLTSADHLAMALAGRGGAIGGVTDINIPTATFLPSDMVSRLGLQDLEAIRGNLSLDASLVDRIARIDASANLPGLIVGGLQANIRLPADAASAIPDMIARQIPVPKEVLGISLARAAVHYDDQGIGDVLAAATGKRPEAHFDSLSGKITDKVEAKLPGFIAKQVLSGAQTMRDIIANGGGIILAPSEPVTILTIAMEALSGGSGMQEKLGADVRNLKE